MLCLFPLSACAYGFPRNLARNWLEKERLLGLLGPAEIAFLEGNASDAALFKLQIEGMWALAWVLSVAQDLSPSVACPNNFVEMLPDLKRSESSAAFRAKVRRRPPEEIFGAADLYYCTHWAVRQIELDGAARPKQVRKPVVVERRRALEWVIGTEPWWEVSLDT